MLNIAGTIDSQLVAAGIIVVSVSIGDPADKSTWTVLPANLQGAAQPTIDSFDVPAEETLWQWWVIRTERDQQLYGCDWTQISGAPLDAAEITEWATYRQALRNVPEDQTAPYAIVWPTPPFVINPPPT